MRDPALDVNKLREEAVSVNNFETTSSGILCSAAFGGWIRFDELGASPQTSGILSGMTRVFKGSPGEERGSKCDTANDRRNKLTVVPKSNLVGQPRGSRLLEFNVVVPPGQYPNKAVGCHIHSRNTQPTLAGDIGCEADAVDDAKDIVLRRVVSRHRVHCSS